MFIDIFLYFALIGTVVVVVAIACAALQYRGKRGERYSLLNHFISELGEVGVSTGARLFNLGLVLGGLLLLPFIVGLGIVLNTWLAWLGVVVGVVTALGVSAVGVFPMNNLDPHIKAAMTFFRGGLAMVIVFGLAIQLQPAERIVIPKVANLLSLVAAAAFGSFLLLPRLKKPDIAPLEALDPEQISERPRFWPLAFLEWLVFFATIFWLFGIAFFV
ncbi:MAG: DUF998 domain-containing protein [Anaerolineales bacterium]|nr:DUF998 domain-containing protein [Anaerolineales bacterium]